jgi:hypothetical protein
LPTAIYTHGPGLSNVLIHIKKMGNTILMKKEKGKRELKQLDVI